MPLPGRDDADAPRLAERLKEGRRTERRRCEVARGPLGDGVHAGSAWDPVFAQLESSGLVRTVAQGLVTSVVVMDDDFVKANPGSDAKFMQAMGKAYEQYKADTAKANEAFKAASNLDFSLAALDLAASVEPNLDAANILYNVLKTTTSGGVTVGPILMGAAATAYILTPADRAPRAQHDGPGRGQRGSTPQVKASARAQCALQPRAGQAHRVSRHVGKPCMPPVHHFGEEWLHARFYCGESGH